METPGNGTAYDAGIRLTSPFPKTGPVASQENADFTATEDFDINAQLGRNGSSFTISNDGGGDFSVSHSEDGAVFTGPHTVKAYEPYKFPGINIHTIKITHLGIDSCYRAMAI